MQIIANAAVISILHFWNIRLQTERNTEATQTFITYPLLHQSRNVKLHGNPPFGCTLTAC